MALDRRAFLAALAIPVAAQAQPEPALQLGGAIAEPNPRRLTRSAIEALGLRELVTVTPWTHGPQRFSGVPLATVLDHVRARGETLRATALNDYAVAIERSGALAADALLATRLNDQPISVRERGPFWIVFPWSQRRELDSALVRQWAIWQLARIEVT